MTQLSSVKSGIMNFNYLYDFIKIKILRFFEDFFFIIKIFFYYFSIADTFLKLW